MKRLVATICGLLLIYCQLEVGIPDAYGAEPEGISPASPMLEQSRHRLSVLKPGKVAPSFELKALDGKTYHVGGHNEKVLLLNFWASWCEPCRLEAPDLQQLALKYKDKLNVYGVNVTAYDDEESAKAFVDQYDLHFPILMDRKEQVYGEYNGAAFPTQVLIDRNGIIQDIIIGLLPPEQLEEKIRQLITN